MHELVFRTRWVNRGHLFQDDAIVVDVIERFRQATDGLGLVAFHGDVAGLDLQRVHQDPGATHNLRCILPHQHIVTTDAGFALDAIEDQAFDLGGLCLHELLGGGEHGAAEPDDAPVENVRQQVRRRHDMAR